MWKYVIWSFCFPKPYKIKFSFLCRWFNHIIKIQNRITKLPCLPTVLRGWWKSISCKKTKIMFFQKRSRENCWNSLSHRWSSYWCTRIQWWWRNRRSERKKPEKNSMGFEPVISRYRWDALPCNWAMKPLTLGGPWKKPICSREFFSGFFTQLHKLRSLRRSFLHFHFISPVHIWFISYIVNKKKCVSE